MNDNYDASFGSGFLHELFGMIAAFQLLFTWGDPTVLI